MKSLSLVALACVAGLIAGCGGDGQRSSTNPPAIAASAAEPQFRVLVFHRAESFYHYAIPRGIELIESLGREHGFAVDTSEDPSVFTPDNLQRYQAVVWLNTAGAVIDTDEQRQAIEQYMRAGGGYVGIHSAADAEYEWPFYGRMVGAYFKSHGIQQFGTLVNEAPDQPSTAAIPARWSIYEEFYSFRSNPRDQVRVLLSIDENTYFPDPNTTNLPGSPNFPWGESGVMGDHPMSWCHTNVGGVAWYTALGHEGNLYAVSRFKAHILNGILTAAGQIDADCQTS